MVTNQAHLEWNMDCSKGGTTTILAAKKMGTFTGSLCSHIGRREREQD